MPGVVQVLGSLLMTDTDTVDEPFHMEVLVYF